jgi:type II secretory pathway pseudopilin PulG
MRSLRLQRVQKGMTIIETIIAFAIVGLIVSAIAAFQGNIFTYNKQISNSLITSQDARAILRTMVTELRSASSGSDGSYAIVTAATNTLAFFADTNGDSIKEKIRYFASSTKLYRGVTIPSGSPLSYNPSAETITLIAPNLRNDSANPIFVYYDGTYNGTASTTELAQPVTVTAPRLVKISLILDVDQNSLPISRTYTSEVAFRNLKDNL